MQPALVHTPFCIGMPHMAEYTCRSSVAFERPNEMNLCVHTLLAVWAVYLWDLPLCCVLRLAATGAVLEVQGAGAGGDRGLQNLP